MKKLYILIFSGLLLIDLLLKNLMMNMGDTVVIKNFLSFIYVKNTGAAFSILSGKTWILIAFTIIALIALSIYLYKNKLKHYEYVLLSVVLSGIIGNLIDRIRFEYVRDFISFKIFSWNAPIFNAADMYIVIGVIIYIIILIKEDLCK